MVAEIVSQLIEEATEAQGFEVVQLKIDAARRVRVWIDREPDGVNLNDCMALARAFKPLLEAEGFDPGSFQIEVLSPGIDRLLVRDKDFVRFAGQPVVLQLKLKAAGERRKYKGKLTGLTNGRIHLQGDDDSWSFDRREVREVRLDPILPFANAGSNGAGSGRHTKANKRNKHDRRKSKSKRGSSRRSKKKG